MIGCALGIVAAALAAVELRGGAVIDAPVVDVSIEGVLLGGESPRMIGWDRARRVVGDHAGDAEVFADVAEDAWRARVRLARGDFALAEPLFERLFEVYRGLEGPTALVVSEGLMRCRLARGDAPGAIGPWLEALRLRRAGHRLVGEPPIPALLDEVSGLVPTLAPIFGSTRAETPIWLGAADGEIETLARWYATALTGAPAPKGDLAGASAGVSLVAHVAMAQSARPDEREAARVWLTARLAAVGDTGTWEEAWVRCALGLLLLQGASEADAAAGLLHLAHLPARFGADQPALTGVALGAMLEHVARRGEIDQAAALGEDLRAFDPDHPALRMSRGNAQ